ncbi:SDR family NAD(P)-dependent oxidoreductase, partial [Alphaproteobacteria bacterium]|nr:SDR family NAD(P)-dependent oxidoreductase [Alphaproteobacteria bacterium]
MAKADAVADGLVSRRFDGLVNNAGIAVTAALHASSEDDVRRVIDTNFLGSLWTLQAAVPVLK